MVSSCMTVKSKENLEKFYMIVKNRLNSDYIHLNRDSSYFRITFDRQITYQAAKVIAEILIRCYAVFFISCLAECDFSEISDDDFYQLMNYFAEKVIEEEFEKEIDEVYRLITEFAAVYKEISIDGFFVFCLRKYQNKISNLYDDYLLDLISER